ncbi:kelch repeat-containing protein [Skeletonema marinoi]|uniref:Kelch repeat-containing protein n=1 Tax=Skeletonema marinoi TaxID=267567 RepID=A0AAD9DFK0_9STRA|nr:kelch repeat-containing protein [Skeletonema marinoi]
MMDPSRPKKQAMLSMRWEKAAAAMREGNHKEALRLYHSLLADSPQSDTAMINEAIEGVIDEIYGPKGSDESICVWKHYPLLSKSKPPGLQFRATCQMGDKIYVHGGCDFCENDILPSSDGDEVWEFNITKRQWRHIKTAGKSPGPRTGHSMFPWKGDLYLWGGMMEERSGTPRRYYFTKLYKLNMTGKGPVYKWEVVKTRSQEPIGREEYAGVLYKGKYYVHAGNNPNVEGSALKDTWVLNLSNFKWSPLKDGPVTRHCHCMWAGNNKLYVLGGRTDIPQDPANFSLMNVSNPSIEDFVSFDLGTKTWKYEDLVGKYRPHDLSEFTVLPLYNKDGDDEPSSVVIWGGYRDPGRPKTMTLADMKAKFGEEHEEFRLPYKKRLLRFDMKTNVWKPLKPTSPILPKAQSFMCRLKSENGITHFLIAEGYGVDPDHDTRDLSERTRAEAHRLHQDAIALGHQVPADFESYMNGQQLSNHKPQYSNKVYEVLVTESFGERREAGWSWNFFKLSADKLPGVETVLHPASPTLHNVVDLSLDDFLQPQCDLVVADDQNNLFGVRVKFDGLKGRQDLNGEVGRCGRWLNKTGRYEVFLPLYENGGKLGSISVKPENLLIADAVTTLEVEELLTYTSSDKRFPPTLINLARTSESDRPPLDDIIDPIPIARGGGVVPIFDTYRGPLSKEAHALLRTIANPEIGNDKMIACSLLAQKFSDEDRRNPNTKKMTESSIFFSQFVRDRKAKDSVRVASFEASMAKFSDSMVDEVCGKWLKVVVKLDGIHPPIRREFVVRPAMTLRALHDQVLCPVMGWKSNYHCYAYRKVFDDLQKLKDSCWIGPRTSTALDSMFMPLYVGGCVANDKQISIGQLYASEQSDNLTVQWVHDFGDWYSHSIDISRCDGKKVPSNAHVAYLMGGEGLNIPEDAGGLFLYEQLIGKLTHRFPMEISDENDNCVSRDFTDPSSEHWWGYFNTEVRNKPNMQRSLGNPLEFNLDLARIDVEAAIRRPTQKSGRENQNVHSMDFRTGLIHEKDKKVSASQVKDATKLCAVCGVTVALRKCSSCKSVAYCSREHQVEHWKEHKSICKAIQKSKK